ncbi:hypothetical protein K525DRAFT_233716 [Schizophyllum commune Loenen D]|nr:hypothetical protein K525DRAFT_233716 [Schizophyllum commune Loenen D]
MPADTSGVHARRHSVRKSSGDDDLEVRRARGELSCAECRRLKLKCDKKIPCGSCAVRRGCPSICPNGSLSSGQGMSRFVLADTTELHGKIQEMGQRIRQLEDALAIFQAGVSNETHPLLRPELLSIKFGPERLIAPEREKPRRDHSVDSIDALGTLTIGERGDAKYFGRSAGSETLFLAGAELEPPIDEDDDYSPLAAEIARLSSSFPFNDGFAVTERTLDLLYTYLPEQPRAWTLCETYLEHAAWSFRPLKRDEIIDDLLTPVYKLKKQRATDPTVPHSVSAHKLAVLYCLFAIGALVDLTLPPFNAEARNYHHLGRAALSSRSVFDSPEIATVQAVLLMANFHTLGGKRYTMDSAWSLTSLACKLSQTLIVDRDPARWHMDPKTVQRRRNLFWELFAHEHFLSLALGRPAAIRLSYCDCEFPYDDEQTLDDKGQPRIGHHRWKIEFARDILAVVTESVLTADPPSYETILDLDRKVREKVLPEHLDVFLSPHDEHYTPFTFMKGGLLSQYRAITLLYIHRSFFAQAMLDHPANPLRSAYAPSFLAAYRCASKMIKTSLNHFERFPELCLRWWNVWTHLFSAAITVGCIVTRAPSSTMASSAFIELGLACDMFAKGAVHSRRARSGFAVLCKLRLKAFKAYSQFMSGGKLPKSEDTNYCDDELAIFGGHTRVLVSKMMSRWQIDKAGCNGKSPKQLNGSSPAASTDSAPASPMTEVHPSLVEYLSLLPPGSQVPSPPSASEGLTDSEAAARQSAFSYVTGPAHKPTALPSLTQQFTPALCNGWTAPSTTLNGNGGPSTLTSGTTTQMPPDASMFFDMYGQSFPTTDATAPLHATEDAGLMDLGMLISGESAIDEQWMSFMRDTVLTDKNSRHA